MGHKPESTLPGLVISVISIAIMWALVAGKRKVGRALNSQPILADANCTMVCIYMSVVLLVSSLVYELTGFGFVDSIGALGLIWFSYSEGREAFEKARPHIHRALAGEKTSLINRLIGHDALDTSAVSGTGEGVHTTARRQLLVLDSGAMLIDTPGMRELGLIGASDGLDDTFFEIREHSQNCRFADCTHTEEPGCAVLLAVENGILSEDRYQSYIKLRKETEFHNLSYAEKRSKDKSFGRFIKSVKKTMKE